MHEIEQTLSEEIHKNIPSSYFTAKTPHALMEAIAVLISTHSSNDPSLLYAKAQDLRLGPGDNLKDYLENHIELRDQLTAANYPGITSDVFAIDFILSGI